MLEQLSLDERKVCDDVFQKMESVLNIPIDYKMVEGILQEERKRGIGYIRKQLGTIAAFGVIVI